MTFQVPITRGKIDLPKFKAKLGLKSDGLYDQNDLEGFIKQIPLRKDWSMCGSYVVHADVD